MAVSFTTYDDLMKPFSKYMENPTDQLRNAYIEAVQSADAPEIEHEGHEYKWEVACSGYPYEHCVKHDSPFCIMEIS